MRTERGGLLTFTLSNLHFTIPRLFIDATETGIKAVRFVGERKRGAVQRLHGRARKWKMAATRELRAYFAGQLRSFSVPCDLSGLTPFARDVLKITAQIPYGEVKSYRWIAERLGKPKATRAVGNALARNSIPVIIPCHRVIRRDGSLGGYALGVKWKQRLLELERREVRR